jgi:hypothetical protein
MKNILLGCLFIIGSLYSTKSHAQNKDADQLVQKLWTAIKNSDGQRYIELFPNYEQLKTLFRSSYEQITDTAIKATMEKEFAKLTEKKYKEEMQPEMIEEFNKFLVNSRRQGIDLNGLSFDSSTYAITKKGELGMSYRTLKGTIYLKNDSAKYELPFSESIWSEPDQRWYGVMLGRIKKQGGKEEIIGSAAEVNFEGPSLDSATIAPATDSIIYNDDVKLTPPQPPPPKVIKKPETPTKKSPARKTKAKS